MLRRPRRLRDARGPGLSAPVRTRLPERDAMAMAEVRRCHAQKAAYQRPEAGISGAGTAPAYGRRQNMQHSAFPPPPGWKYYLSSTVLDFAVQMGSGNPR